MDERVAFFRVDENSTVVGAPSFGKLSEATEPGMHLGPQSSRGPVGRMQAALATAVNDDPDWKEF
jgi:hypothetical protein